MKRFFIEFFAVIFFLLILIGGFDLAVDPLYHYHAPMGGTAPYLFNQVYQMPGVASHFQYDSAIVGTSMTENFRVSWFEEMGLHAVKLSYSGARSLDIRTVLDKVYESGNEVKYILMDVNDYQLTVDASQRYVEQPAYLYRNVWWDDTEYLWNNDVFWMSVGRVLEKLTNSQPKLDDAYTWEEPELFSAEIVKEGCREYVESLREKTQEGYDWQEEYANCEDNLNNIIPVIEAHPETEFVIFYPPYSILYWEEQVLSGRAEGILEIYKYSMSRLLKYENVRIFAFQDEEEIITNLDNYRDVCHHTPQVNRYIFDSVMSGNKEITAENIDAYFEGMRRMVSEYPYEVNWID
ncbi:MAG: hypothetical protein HDR08_07715 [Lachnospiraceae bacterium]|nr:hypothetical protein [Lachnospiraceae bacterium]